jgi:hypothetical protein
MNLALRAQTRALALSRILAATFLSGTLAATALAQAPQYDARAQYGPAKYGPPQYNPLVDTRCGGVLQESYDYQRGGQAPGLISPATPWYHYGFPVSTYRWGWFGAEHYYPTVWWGHGYYGDCCRYGYRCGY